jgi:hypothetical protein
MKGILHLINNLLQPLIKDKFHSKTFPTANEAIEALIKYYDEPCYDRSRLLLVTIHLHDLRTTLSHHLMIEGLENFFRCYVPNNEIHGLSTTTIIQLIRLILENQFCIYDNALYQQMIGSSIDSPLITTLIDIYIFYWQYDLLRTLNKKRNIFFKRYFGRCLNQIVFIWNGSRDELLTFLNQQNLTHSNYDYIQKTVSMDHKISYLDGEFSDIEGILQTRVYHHLNFEPYALPYISSKKTRDSESHASLLCAALVRAILYCSDEREFENELFYIELSFLLNDVSWYFIQTIIENFFLEFNLVKKDICFDKSTYQFLRWRIARKYHQQSEYHLQQEQKRGQRSYW